MRAQHPALMLSNLLLASAFGCGAAGSTPSTGGASSSAGASAGGTAAGGDGAPVGGTPGGMPAAGAAGAADGKLVDCDVRQIVCKRLAPVCDSGQVPSVDGTCYGTCVDIEQCACSAPEECPDPNQYTCWNSQHHCGPYVQ